MYTQLVNNKDKVLFTKEAPKWDDGSYLGYSITTGDFVGKGEDSGIAVGMPRGADLHGKVHFFIYGLQTFFFVFFWLPSLIDLFLHTPWLTGCIIDFENDERS